jgi:DDE superfamily endonuclease/Helix-turn-helix of DDE superfamily endonuclease
MLTYEELKTKPRKFLTFTSLTLEEYAELLPVFEKVYLKAYPASQTQAGKKRKRKRGGGRKSSLDRIEQKLLFALVYQKSYPLQSVQGELFGIAQSRANEWIHRLLPILKQALEEVGATPERNPKKFNAKEQNQPDAVDSIIDGTERRRQRPKKAKKQALHYSGKKKTHSDKNVIIATAKRKRVSFLSQTYPGKTHDKKVADTEKISYPTHITLHQDTGFQGYKPKVQKLCQPKKNHAVRN